MSEELKETVEAEKETTGKRKKEKVKKSVGQEILEWVLTILVAVVAALVIRAFIFEPVRVDGHSMDDTLANGEIMFVTKFDYASTWLSLPWQSNEAKEKAPRIVTGFGAPKRFDVIVCRYPGRGDANFVKRIVGIPGDELFIRDGFLYVKAAGEETFTKYDEPYINDDYRVSGGSNGWRSASEEQPYVVPEGEYFVMGDHRNNSNDSRAQGPITRDMIVGHVRQILFPFNHWRPVKNGLDY